MQGPTTLIVIAAIFWLSGCTSVSSDAASGGRDNSLDVSATEVARLAAWHVDSLVRIRAQAYSSLSIESRRTLDSALFMDLYWMEFLAARLREDPKYVGYADIVIAALKREGMERPPVTLDQGARSFIDRVCARSQLCPAGTIDSPDLQTPTQQ